MSIEALCWDRDFEKFVNENENTYRIKIHSIFDKVINSFIITNEI